MTMPLKDNEIILFRKQMELKKLEKNLAQKVAEKGARISVIEKDKSDEIAKYDTDINTVQSDIENKEKEIEDLL